MSDSVLVSRDAAIATVTLNNPTRLNALSRMAWIELGEVIAQLDADDSLRCIVMRGSGTKAFAAGADIAEFRRERANVDQAREYGRSIASALHGLARCRHPVVAMIHGVCVGGGLEIACQCDLRICGESSRFGVPVKNLGLVMAYAELQGLIELCGKSGALEIALEGRVFGAADAKAKGLVNRVVPDHEVEGEAYAAARRIAEGAPLVARWHKKFVNRLMDSKPLAPEEYDESFACFGTEDYRIGREAFIAKKKPEFKGC
ncbi:MAG: enoyl-CoA hydratase [Betaproteobacteria bacterium RIFCSPLOWO2_02_FULL_63_19]|nr:MAG: enoyl-CoA hydratase [Betaproteobacteria bacterium RIFCSPLOWO2_02_FULL_63_19]